MLCCHSHPAATELAERLCALLPGEFAKKAWFGTTGSDANDCVARLLPLATGRRRLISFVGGYHGTTSGSAALSGHQAQAAVIGGGNVTKVPYPDPYRCLHGPVQPRRLLAEVPRARRAVRARRGLAGCRHGRDRDRGRAVRRRRGRAARELPAGAARAVRPARHLARVRRGQDRPRADGADVRVRARAAWSPTPSRSASRSAAGCRCRPWSAAASCSTSTTYSLFTLGGSPVPVAGALATLDVIAAEGLVDERRRDRACSCSAGLEAIAGRSPADRRRPRQRPDPRRRARPATAPPASRRRSTRTGSSTGCSSSACSRSTPACTAT